MKGKLVFFSLLLCALQAAYGQDKELKLVYEAYYPEVPAFVSSVSDELVREALLTGYREARGEYTVRLCHQKYLCEHTYTNGNMEDGNCPPAEYIDLADSTRVYQRYVEGTLCLVSGRMAAPQWEITGRTRQIGDYACMEARRAVGHMACTAWFAPEVPVGVGPVGQCGLPGLIVSMMYGDRAYVLKEVSHAAASAIVPPKEGKRVSEEQFGSMMAAAEARKQARGANGISTVTTITHSDGRTEVIEE